MVARTARRFYLIIAMAPLLVAFAAAWFVAAVDPYDLRPWGAKIELTDEIYPQDMIPRLIYAAARSQKTLIVAGGSSVLRIKSETVRSAFGKEVKPFNLSFAGIKPADLALILDELSRSTDVKRVVATVDGTMLQPGSVHRQGFPRQYYPISWNEPATDLDWQSLGDAALVMSYGRLSREARRKTPLNHAVKAPLPLRKADFKKLEANLQKTRAQLFKPTSRTCDQIDSMAQTFVPAARAFSERGIALDLLIPPYSLAAYGDVAARQKRNSNAEQPAYFAEQMLLRRCVVEAVSSFSNVRVHGFDNDADITGDLNNYRDTTHIQEQSVYEKILKGIAAGTHVLTPETWPDYERTLAHSVATFELKSP